MFHCSVVRVKKNRKIHWCNWVKPSAGAFYRFFGTYIGMNWERINMISVIHFLQFLLIWAWNINETYILTLMSHGDYYRKVRFIILLLLWIFFEGCNKEYLLTKTKQFSKFDFEEICSQCLTTSRYLHIWN